ncbi:MAG: hypothetical protein WCR21_06380 [Bacteroidota bacterium]
MQTAIISSSRYRNLFYLFLCTVVISFFYLRPLKSAWHPFIAGDGLGYYAYLPATFIYHDKALNFAWFNKVYRAHYVNSSFDNPEDNFLVQYGDKKINKYYQGLSFIWMPFFFVGHLTAKLMHAPADGFSQPYQLSMAFASLFYLIIALWYLRKLLQLLFQHDAMAAVIPMLIFYGSHLFPYAIFSNTLSHVYSLCFNILFLYFLHKTFNEKNQVTIHAALALLFYCITVGIRPLNALVLLLLPVFYQPGFHWRNLKSNASVFFILLVCLVFIVYQARLMFLQTHSFFPYTYSNESFDFMHARFWEAMFSYKIGLFVYVPMLLLSMAGLFYLPHKKWLILFLFFMGILFLYSAWWYWPINRRAMIDYYFIPAIFMGFACRSIKWPAAKFTYYGLLFSSVLYYQLKNYQMQNGILDEFKTYKDIYWRNFFRTEKANMYLIEPNAIEKKQDFYFDFEKDADLNFVQKNKVQSGKQAMVLSPDKNFVQLAVLPFPKLFDTNKANCIRFSLSTFFEKDITAAHLFIQFYDTEGTSILDVPFYLHADDIFPNRWDLKEFGYEIENPSLINSYTVQSIGIAMWNLEAKRNIYVDDLKVEFILLKP